MAVNTKRPRIRHAAPMPEVRRRSQVEQAVDRVADREAARPVGVAMLPAVRVAPASTITIEAPPNGTPVVMLVDPAHGGWRPIALPPGTRWELRQQSIAGRIVGVDGKPLA